MNLFTERAIEKGLKNLALLVKAVNRVADALEAKNKERTAETPAWQPAIKVIRDLCAANPDCEDCPMYEWCFVNLPEEAGIPEDWSPPEEDRS